MADDQQGQQAVDTISERNIPVAHPRRLIFTGAQHLGSAGPR